MRVFSFGGGVQSMSALVLSAKGELPYTHFVFSNVGDDSENPETIKYIADVAIPYAEKHSLSVIEVKRNHKRYATLLDQIVNDQKSIPIPVYITKKPARRICTSDWKIEVINKWMRENAGASKDNRQPIGVGISLDEYQRVRTDDPTVNPYTYKEYPLIDLRLTRNDCRFIIESASLPSPAKSSCWFCPYTKMREWTEMRKDRPELFNKAVHLESMLIGRFEGKYGSIRLTNANAQMEQAVPQVTANMFDDDDNTSCESGYCMT